MSEPFPDPTSTPSSPPASPAAPAPPALSAAPTPAAAMAAPASATPPTEPAPLPAGGPFGLPPLPSGGPFAGTLSGPGPGPRARADLGPTYRPAGSFTPDPPPWTPPPGRLARPEHGSGLAIAAFVLACQAILLLWLSPWASFGWPVLLGVIALALGIPAWVRAARGRSTGTGLAVAAVIIAALTTSVAGYQYARWVSAVHQLRHIFDATPVATATPGGIRTDNQYPFGTTITFRDGVSLTIGKGVPFTPSRSTLADPRLPRGMVRWLEYPVTVVNGSERPIYPATTITAPAVGSVTPRRDLLDVPGPADPTRLAPGATLRWQVGYGLQDGVPVMLEVSLTSGSAVAKVPFLAYHPIVFTDLASG